MSEYLTMSIRFDATKMEKFKTIAASNHRSVAQHIRFIMDREIAENENGNGDQEPIAA